MRPRVFRGVEVLGSTGDEETVARIAEEIASPGVEQREGADGVRYRVFFPEGPPLAFARRLRELWATYAGGEPPPLSPLTEEERDWADAGRRAFGGTEVGPFWIGPPWLAPPPNRSAIRINPGRAFGTGLHPTTRLALVLLLPRVAPQARVLDVGTGSGILALAALALGAARVTALDVDLHALRNARENALLNAAPERLLLVAGSAGCLAPGLHGFDPVVANLEHALLLPLLPLLVSALAPEGSLVVSGITLEQRDAFLTGAEEEAFAVHETAEEEGWWAAALLAR
ncbi:MAG: 50S ribosomal protein L11 methyltransferase [Gemmatimonadota bacterium]